MPEVTVVGAGLSGLVAAIDLARRGHEVTVLERESRPGGMPEYRPDPAGSWFDLAAVERWTGVDISPAVKLIDRASIHAYGRRYDLPLKASIKLYMLERGARSTSIDTLLTDRARSLGVDIRYDRPVRTADDFMMLPTNTIVATGLQSETYQAMNIPYSPLYFWYSKGTVSHDGTVVGMWFDDFSKDYGFHCSINGVCFALLFQRDRPLGREGKEKFVRMLAEAGVEGLEEWRDLEGLACPVGSIRNPRLFHNRKILAGTLCGAIDPLLFYGMLGALVSGRIAAMAVEDKAEAYAAFRKATMPFYSTYALKKALNLVPDVVKGPMLHAALPAVPHLENLIMMLLSTNTPGWRLIAGAGAARGVRGCTTSS